MLSHEVLTFLDQFHARKDSGKLHKFKIAIKVQSSSKRLAQYEKRMVAAKVDLCTHIILAQGIFLFNLSYALQYPMN